MKKIMIIATLSMFTSLYAQVTKSDFEAIFNVFPPIGYEYIYINNIQSYFTDGTNAFNQKQYYANKVMLDPQEHAVYVKFFDDNARSNLTDLQIIPYTKIDYIDGWKTGFTIAFSR